MTAVVTLFVGFAMGCFAGALIAASCFALFAKDET